MKKRSLPARQALPQWSESLQRAIHAHQQGELDVAERLYRDVLQREPSHPDALHFFGVLLHRRGDSDAAVATVKAALAVVPDYPDAHNNLGNIHKECGRLDEAEASYRRAIECAAGHANAWANLAVVLEAQDRPQEAFDAYAQLVHRVPQAGRSYWMMGRFLMRHPESREHLEQSMMCLCRALELDGPNPMVLHDLGNVLYALERRDEARAVYREWLAREPDNPLARHMLAACGGAEVPIRADDAYVRKIFDGFAASFDDQLLHRLDYHAPQTIAAALLEKLPAGARDLDILDAGCGTGLCGPLLRESARRLVGVDLSAGMLEMARRRGIYDELVAAELTGFIAAGTSAWNVIVSADTLVYFGDLEAVCGAAQGALRTNGWFGFSLEAMQGDGFELSPSGRYVHGRDYVEQVLRKAGFGHIEIRSDSLRKERGRPVASWVVLAQRRSSGDQPENEGNRG